jgi:hypothetical protein
MKLVLLPNRHRGQDRWILRRRKLWPGRQKANGWLIRAQYASEHSTLHISTSGVQQGPDSIKTSHPIDQDPDVGDPYCISTITFVFEYTEEPVRIFRISHMKSLYLFPILASGGRYRHFLQYWYI